MSLRSPAVAHFHYQSLISHMLPCPSARVAEKTRQLLGWPTETPNTDSVYPYSLIGCARTPSRKRKTSMSSTPPSSPRNPSVTITCMPVSRSTPHFSSMPISPVSPNTPHPSGYSAQDSMVFERLRELVPTLPTDQNSMQMIVQAVTDVVQLETQLKDLQEQTDGVRSLLAQQQSHCAQTNNPVVPDDLAHVDVTAFKSLVSPLVVDTCPSSSSFRY